MIIRRSLAIASGLGFGTAFSGYVGSFFGLTLEGVGRWFVILALGILALLVPVFAGEFRTIETRRLMWRKFAEARPKWAVRTVALLAFFFGVHFLLFLLSENPYRSKGNELRLFAAGAMCFYIWLMMYWWFPTRQRVVSD